MITATATATEMQNNFGRYLNLVMSGQEIIVTKNGRKLVGLFRKMPLCLIWQILLLEFWRKTMTWMRSRRKAWGQSMVLLIDTNIVLDVFWIDRNLSKILRWFGNSARQNRQRGYISTLTYANMMYVMRKQLTPDQIEEVFRKLNLIFEFADFSPAVLERAVNMKWKDFEDAVQSATAESVHADYIITRNLKNFTRSKVMAFTPTELLARI